MQATDPVFAIKLCWDYAMHNSAASFGFKTFREYLDWMNSDLTNEHAKALWEIRRWFTGETIEEVFNPDRFVLNDEPITQSISLYEKFIRQLGGEFIYAPRGDGERDDDPQDSHIVSRVRKFVTWELACQAHMERWYASDKGEAWKRWHRDGKKLTQEEITARFKDGKPIAIEDLPDYKLSLILKGLDEENSNDTKTDESGDQDAQA